MKLKHYIVATETNVTCVCVAESKEDAVNRCKSAYYEESQWDFEYGPMWWEAYDMDEYFDGDDDVLVLESIEW